MANRAERRAAERKAPKKEVLGQVTLGIIHGHTVEGASFDSMLGLLTGRPELVKNVISLSSGPALHHGRNELTKEFLKTDGEWLLCLDSDMVYSPEHIQEMLRTVRDFPEVKVLGGLAWICQDPRPSNENMKSNCWSQIGGQPTGDPVTFPLNALVKVEATGAACLLIHREVLEAVGALTAKPQWWNHLNAQMDNGDVDMLGEDISFCVKARECGYDIYVHTGIEFGHVKRQILDSRVAFMQEVPKDE